jgi:uncharacterized protein YigE (DUF2233 family)
MTRVGWVAAFILAPLTSALAQSGPCRPLLHEDAQYTVCTVDLRQYRLKLFWRGPDGEAYGSFDRLKAAHPELAFAMNGGMYHKDMSPVGLYVEDGRELKRANTANGPGNFHLKPNGVFFAGRDAAGVLETGQYLRRKPKAEIATQSGPMLVIDGALHPAFIEGSDDRKPRNGVGVNADGVHFAISERPVNFHSFARLFRDKLGCENALFLDGGSASGLYSPDVGRNDWPPLEGYGPIIGVVQKSGD